MLKKIGYALLALVCASVLSGCKFSSEREDYERSYVARTDFTIKFETNGGKSIEPITVKKDEDFRDVEIPTPERSGYDFAYWANEYGIQIGSNDTVNGEPDVAKFLADESRFPEFDLNGKELPMGITLYAIWRSENPSIIINADGGYFPQEDGTKKEKLELKLTNFKGTYTSSELFNDYLIKTVFPLKDKAVKEHYKATDLFYLSSTIIAGTCTSLYFDLFDGKDCEVRIQWNKNQEIVFETNGGSAIPVYEFKDNDNCELKTLYSKAYIPVKEGYVFAGWYKDKDLKELQQYSVINLDSTTLYADWISKSYDITSSNAESTFNTIASKMKFLELDITGYDETRTKRLPLSEELIDMWTVNVKYTGNMSSTDVQNVSKNMKNNNGNSGTVYCNLDLSEATGLTDLPDDGFSDCIGLRSIKISQKISNIGISNTNGSGCFRCCFNLKSVSLPASLTTIGDASFSGCTALTDIIIPDGVTYIGNNVFSGCSKLKNVKIPVSVQTIGSATFKDCVELEEIALPLYVQIISANLFENCKKLSKLTFSEYVDTIDSAAFMKCTSLTSFTIPAPVTTISNETFKECTALTSVEIPDNVITIDNKAFESCEKLKNVTLPSKLKKIGTESFKNCKAFTAIVIPTGVTAIGKSAFNNCENLESINIPSGVKTLSYHVFDGCIKLTDVTLNNGLETIGERAFVDCKALTSITIPSTVTTIKTCAFYNCSSLTGITIPDAVTKIEDSVFFACSKLANIIFADTTTWYKYDANVEIDGTESDVSNSTANVLIFTERDYKKFWNKK